MTSQLGLTGRQIATRLICLHRTANSVATVAASNRRVAIYRRCLGEVIDEVNSRKKRRARTRSAEKREQLELMIDFWLDIARYFEIAIRNNCGERF